MDSFFSSIFLSMSILHFILYVMSSFTRHSNCILSLPLNNTAKMLVYALLGFMRSSFPRGGEYALNSEKAR